MLLTVVLSDVGGRLLPLRIPVPLIQIVLGILLARAGLFVQLPFDPDLFFLIFVAPLLFADAVRMPRRELLRLKGPIGGAAVGLVAATVLLVGLFVHWLLPSISIPMACALAAVLAPTDAVSVGALAGKLAMPSNILHILRGEALLNDASGVVALRVALAVELTGSWQPGRVLVQFLLVSLGDLLLGSVVGWLGAKLSIWLGRRQTENPTGEVLLSLVLPFSSFLGAEHLHLSGILASVASGLTFNLLGLISSHNVQRRIRLRSFWHTLEFILNGLLFLLLGLELPARLAPLRTGPEWLVYPVLIVLALLTVRLVWARLCMPWSNWRELVVLTVAGVRGTVSLAAVLSVPASGIGSRDIVVYLATAVILLSMLVAAVALPWLLKDTVGPEDDASAKEETRARLASFVGALGAIDREAKRLVAAGWTSELIELTANHLRTIYLSLIKEFESEDSDHHASQAFRILRLAALREQREVIHAHLRQGRINDTTRARLEQELDLDQASLQAFMGESGH